VISSEELVAKYTNLGEQYQPIWGVKTLAKVSRDSQDRLEKISRVVEQLEKKLSRKLRILDIGASQGYFSVALAKSGHHVVSIELDSLNSEFIRSLSDFHSVSENVKVINTSILDYIKGDNSEKYDLVICLSVIHHIYHINKASAAQEVIGWVQSHSLTAIYELALTEEKYMYWSKSQPKNIWRDFLTYYFAQELGWFATHLGTSKRPLIFFSSQYIMDLDNKIYSIDEITIFEAHKWSDFNQKYRRSFLLDNRIYKLQFHLPNEETETQLEYKFLLNFGINSYNFNFSKLEPKILFGSVASTFISRNFIEGERVDLMDLSKVKRVEVASNLIQRVQQLSELKLFHNDLRPWNLLWTGSTLQFIDFGDIHSEFKDVNQMPLDLVLILNLLFIFSTLEENEKWMYKKLFTSDGKHEIILEFESLTMELEFIKNRFSNVDINTTILNYVKEQRTLTKNWVNIKSALKKLIRQP
jgi:tRNA A-37 threonylcarbamoyl transferase component Bud32